MGDRRAVHRHLEQVLARPLDGLLDRQRDLVGLAVADADLRLLVAHDHEGREREAAAALDDLGDRSEEHTSELQSRQYLVCRLLLEKKKKLEKQPRTSNSSSR